MRNALIDLLKWPAAIFSIVFACFVARQIPAQVMALLHLHTVWVPVLLGILSYALVWRYWLRTNRTAIWATVFEHEFTHVLASLVTFNGVHRLEANSSGSGHIAVTNEANWIILVAPYVFPTALMMPGMLLAAAQPSWVSYGIFGVALGFHIQSTCVETHCAQSDLHKIGWASATLLLPAYHIIFTLMTVGVLLGHQNGTLQAWKQTKDFLASIVTMALHASSK